MRTFLFCTIAFAFAAPVWADDWAGRTVITKRDGIRIGYSDAAGRQVYTAELKRFEYTVRKEKGDWLLIAQNGEIDWAPKADFVRAENAVDYFTDRIRENPSDAGSWLRRSCAWATKGDLDKAMQDADEAMRLRPDAAAFRGRGNIWTDKGDYDRAIRDQDEAIRLNPNDAAPFYNRGLVWVAQQDYDRAIRDFDESIRLKPEFMAAFHNRGNAWAAKQNYERALGDYDTALRLNPNHATTYYNKALLYVIQGKNDLAFDNLKKALDFDGHMHEVIEKDRSLDAIRDDPRYRELIRK